MHTHGCTASTFAPTFWTTNQHKRTTTKRGTSKHSKKIRCFRAGEPYRPIHACAALSANLPVTSSLANECRGDESQKPHHNLRLSHHDVLHNNTRANSNHADDGTPTARNNNNPPSQRQQQPAAEACWPTSVCCVLSIRSFLRLSSAFNLAMDRRCSSERAVFRAFI